MIKKFSILCLVLLFLVVNTEVRSQIEGEEKENKFSESTRAKYDEVEAGIQKELKTLKNHKWAGEYSYGNGLGTNIRILLSPESGFVFTWIGDLGLYDLNYGKVEERNGKIIFIPALSNKREGFKGMETEFYPVTWGQRHYLIPVSKIIKFANIISLSLGQGEFAGYRGSFALREGDENKTAKGKIDLPNEFRAYLLEKPIKASITQVIASVLLDKDYSKTRTTEMILDVGSRNKVKIGMEFYVFSPSGVSGSVEVIEVNEKTSKAKMVQVMYEKDESLTPAINWKLSTNPY
ncbi:hypothetical protein BH20ACI1_BH20ACI1_31590 [soil metagenome]